MNRQRCGVVGCWVLSLWLGGLTGVAQEPAGDTSQGWRTLLADHDLSGWKVVSFGGEGPVEIKDGVLTLGMGEPMTAVVYTNPVPRIDYEVELETRRLLGNDFPCGLTFPVGDSHLTLIFGGWGGGVVGLSSIDGRDASENETALYRELERNRWYRLEVSVASDRIQVRLDGERIIDLDTRDRKLGLRSGSIEHCTPLGIASYVTQGQVRKVRVRDVAPFPGSKAQP